jgi:hypothetical protein
MAIFLIDDSLSGLPWDKVFIQASNDAWLCVIKITNMPILNHQTQGIFLCTNGMDLNC